MSTVIDLPRIRRALSELDRIATEHPEICQGLGQWDEKAVAGIVTGKTGKPGSERQAEYRRKLASQGYKREVFFVSPQGQSALMTLREQSPDKTRDQILEDALIAKMALTTTTNRNASNDATVDMFGAPGEPSAPAISQAERDQQILELHRQGLSNYAVADKAGCSEATVRRTLKRLNNEVTA